MTSEISGSRLGPTIDRVVDTSGADSRSLALVSQLLEPSDEALQTAARLKILLGPSERMVAFSGLTPNDGTAPLVLKVGAAMATISSDEVLVIDGDLRTPSIHKLLETEPSPGLFDVLGDASELDTACRSTLQANLSVLPIGRCSSPTSLLGTSRASFVFDQMRTRFRYVLVSCGVALDGPAGVMLSSIADGVVVAMAAGRRRQDHLRQFLEDLNRLHLRFVGVVLTMNSPKGP